MLIMCPPPNNFSPAMALLNDPRRRYVSIKQQILSLLLERNYDSFGQLKHVYRMYADKA